MKNLANRITVYRILLIFPAMLFFVLAFLLKQYNVAFLITSCAIFGVLCATDFVDGAIARKTNTVTNLGKFLDPLADKIVIVVMLFLLCWKSDVLNINGYNYSGLVLALCSGMIISREIVVSVFRAIAASQKIVIAADWSGKIKTVLLDVGVAALIVATLSPLLYWFGHVVFYLGTLLAVGSGISMILKNKQVLGFCKKEEKEN